MSVVDLFNQIARNDFGFFKQVQTVADVMAAAPGCLSMDDNLESAMEVFRRGSLDHAPVVNPEDNSIVGIVSDRDLLRNFPRLLGTPAEQDDDHKALKVSVARFMTRNPVCCASNSSPIDAITQMLEKHIDCVVVTSDGNSLEGIVTPASFIQTLLLYHRVCTRDLNLRRLRLVDLDLSNGIPLDEIFSTGAQTVRDVMTKDVKTLKFDDKLSTAMQHMQDREFRHMPVLNAEGKMTGMLSDKDILRYLPVATNTSVEEETRFRQKLFATDDKKAVSQRVDSVMSKDFHAVEPGMLLTDAMAEFSDRSVCGLPVVEPGTGQLCGIITKSDIIRVFQVVMLFGRWSSSGVETPAGHEVACV